MRARAAVNDRPTRTTLGIGGFAKLANVSRETLDRLAAYVALLGAWNRRINLVGRDSMGDVWRRHILDSAQLFPFLPEKAQVLVDLGSGAGLPGLVLALMGVPEVHLVESDQRKAAFLREAVRVTARALAPLPSLLDLAKPFLAPRGICLFLKGRGVEDELTRSAEGANIRWERWPSTSDPSGSILRVEILAREPRTGR
jgi:16S rRNA (guanine527-N7)-methyltransferase